MAQPVHARVRLSEHASVDTPVLTAVSPHLAASHPVLSAEGDLPTWARERHAKLVHAFVHAHTGECTYAGNSGCDAEAIGFAYLRRAVTFRRQRTPHIRARFPQAFA
jgi:hypothetical protein